MHILHSEVVWLLFIQHRHHIFNNPEFKAYENHKSTLQNIDSFVQPFLIIYCSAESYSIQNATHTKQNVDAIQNTYAYIKGRFP